MAINAEITKVGTENSANILRKFTRRIQSTGIVRQMRSKRYYERTLSDFGRKKKALRKIERRNEFETLIKEGKISEQMRGRRFKWRSK